MATDYIARAERYLREARTALEEGDFATAIRRSQECVGLAVKAVLRLAGIEYPRKRDVSDSLDLLRSVESVPEYFLSSLTSIQETVRGLAALRGLAMYGDETTFTPPSALFRRDDAVEAVRQAEETFELCRRLVADWTA